VETDPAGYVSSTPNSVSVTVTAGAAGVVNFGDYQLSNTAPANITGTVFNDVNANGVQDAGESPLTGVTVQLANSGGTVIATTTTNASGAYNFTNLPAGSYTVIETDPAGYTSTTLNNVGVTLSSGTTATVNFGDQAGVTQIADPAITKNGSPSTASVGTIVVYTITVGNTGNIAATNVILTDTKPVFLDIISITISPNPGLTPVISGNTFTINFGTVTPADSYIVTVVTRVNSQGVPPGGSNNVSITTGSTGDRSFNNASKASLQINANSSGGGHTSSPKVLPSTGFAPGVVTDLGHMQQEAYASTPVTIEIPALGIQIPIVGVPQSKDGTWDVSWLSKQAGWLEGTAFPSWSGNSVLTGHVYDSNGLPGPFVNLNKLKYGDKIIIHAYGQKYIFEVSTNQVVAPNDISAFKHEDKAWLTLITCKEYDAQTNTYKQRVVVKAVLVSVGLDK
jgi:LPXTG-site transpeptidase (sortase) family protein